MIYNLDEMPINIIEEKPVLEFFYQKKIYYFKYATEEMVIKELVAEKIAKRLDIPCCHYTKATYKGLSGIVSEAAHDIYAIGYQEMINYLQRNTPNEFTSFFQNYNLEDIWNEFYMDPEIPLNTIKKLMDEIIDIFLFDILIANSDRHGENLAIIKDGKNTHMAPIFDHDKMLSPLAYTMGKYCLTIEKNDTLFEKDNLLYKFLTLSDKSYQEKLLEKIEVISEESLLEIFKELIEEGTTIEQTLIEEMLEKFALNREMIKKYFELKKEKAFK